MDQPKFIVSNQKEESISIQRVEEPSLKYNHIGFNRLIDSSRPPDKLVCLKNIFPTSQPKHMLWVLKRTISMRRFFRAPKIQIENSFN